MTETTARNVANVVLCAAAVGAAYVVLRTPTLRRLAWALLRTTVTTTIPTWLGKEVQDAWAASGEHGTRPRTVS